MFFPPELPDIVQHVKRSGSLRQIVINFADNGFILGVLSVDGTKQLVLQAGSDSASEIQPVLDVIEKLYYDDAKE